MRFLLPLVCVLTLAGQGNAQQNPLTYNATTTLATNPDTTSPPSLGAVGTFTTDPFFGTTILRVTQSASCAQDAGFDFQTPNNGSIISFNSNDSEILFQGDDSGDRWFIENVNLATGAIGTCTKLEGGIFINNTISFSSANPNLLWGFDWNNGNDISTYNFATSTQTDIKDVTTIPGISFNTGFGLMLDNTDTWACFLTNVEDVAEEVACYNTVTGASQWLNLTTATEQQNPAGMSGSPTALDNLNTTTLAGCEIHESYGLRDGTWLVLGMNGCSNYPAGTTMTSCCSLYWQLGTNHVTYQTSSSSSGGGVLYGGHRSMGVNGVITIGTPTPDPPCGFYGDWAYWDAKSPGVNGTPHYAAYGGCDLQPVFDDDIVSWNNDYNDSFANQYPVMIFLKTQTANTTTPLQWEVFGFQTSAAYASFQAATYGTPMTRTSTIYRFAYTYNDPASSQCASVIDSAAPVSNDGKYVMFTSDWQGGTGSSMGTMAAGNCANNRRTDVFVVKLPLVGNGPAGFSRGRLP